MIDWFLHFKLATVILVSLFTLFGLFTAWFFWRPHPEKLEYYQSKRGRLKRRISSLKERIVEQAAAEDQPPETEPVPEASEPSEPSSPSVEPKIEPAPKKLPLADPATVEPKIAAASVPPEPQPTSPSSPNIQPQPPIQPKQPAAPAPQAIPPAAPAETATIVSPAGIAGAQPSPPPVAHPTAPQPSAIPQLPQLPQNTRQDPILGFLYTQPPANPDPLQVIHGIGPAEEAWLHKIGIYRFMQLISWEPVTINAIDGPLGLKGRIRNEQWIEQARRYLYGQMG